MVTDKWTNGRTDRLTAALVKAPFHYT